MKAWIISVAAVGVLTVLLELLLIEGQVKKYITGFVRLLLIITMISPLIKLVGGEINFDIESETEAVSNNYEYYEDYVGNMRIEKAKNAIYEDLITEGFCIQDIVINYHRDAYYTLLIDEVVINVDCSCINENLSNIILKNKVMSIVRERLDISEEKIIINGIDGR